MAFEAIARLQSVSRAASELSITQAAASIRLKGLEEDLGFPLFMRQNGQFNLTSAGRRYLATVHRVIGELMEGAERAIRPSEVVRLCVRVDLAQKWLIPHMSGLMEHINGIEIDMQTFDDDLEDATEGDLFIGYRPMEKLSSVKLMDDEFIAVARPEIAEEVRTFRPSELQAVRWLHEAPAGARTSLADPLVDWLGRLGLGLDDIGPRLAFHHPSLLVDAALHGLGVSLVRHSLVVGHLVARQVVQLFHHAVPGAEPIYLSFAAGQQRDPVIGKVHQWLLQQAAMHRQMMAGKEGEARILRNVADAQVNSRGEKPQGPPYPLLWAGQWPIAPAPKVAGQVS